MNVKNNRPILLCAAVLIAFTILPRSAKADEEATILPITPIESCRAGLAKLYDECGSQVALFHDALDLANREGKILLVSFGAEWCIWCHVFDAYVTGEHSSFTYTYSDQSDETRYTSTLYEFADMGPEPQAESVADYFADSFVLVHIEDRYSDDGADVLEMTNADVEFWGALPFIFSVTSAGEYAGKFDSNLAETRRDSFFWFRGYDRSLLSKELVRLREAAQP